MKTVKTLTTTVLALAVLLGLVQAAHAQTAPVIEYYHLDGGGSVRAVTNESGQVVRRHDYFAFGEGEGVSAGQDPMRFTSQERDAETALDYFGARYYASRTGRFTTVDPVMNIDAAVSDPQRWNRYVYALNSPLTFVDPTGEDPRLAIWTRIVQSPVVQRLVNHPATQRLMGSTVMTRGTDVLSRLSDRLFELSLKLTGPSSVPVASNVWHAIEATGPKYTNTILPTQFNMNVGGTTVQVVSNASKHIFQHLLGLSRAGVSPENIDLAAQVRLASLQQAVSQALTTGVQHRQVITAGGWELVFAIEKGKHILIHALPQ